MSKYLREVLRLKPARDLLSGIHKTLPNPCVVDLGCGDGYVIPHLRQHWPRGDIICLDSDKDQLREATSNCIDSGVAFVHGTIEEWKPIDKKPDVIFANSVFHLVPNHTEVIQRLFSMLPPGGVLAFQMPIIENSPQSKILREAIKELGFEDPDRLKVHTPEVYYNLIQDRCNSIESWTTSHHHFVSPNDVINLLTTPGTGGSIWKSYTKSIPVAQHQKLSELASSKFTSKVGDEKTCFSIERFYMVAVKEGHGPTLGFRA